MLIRAATLVALVLVGALGRNYYSKEFNPEIEVDCRARTVYFLNASDDYTLTSWNFLRIDLGFSEDFIVRMPLEEEICHFRECTNDLSSLFSIPGIPIKEGYPFLNWTSPHAWLLRGTPP